MILSKTVIWHQNHRFTPELVYIPAFHHHHLKSQTFDALEIHNVMLFIEKVFCGEPALVPVGKMKYNQSNHSLWQHLICLKESLGKKHRNI